MMNTNSHSLRLEKFKFQINDKNPEELADILEVIYRIAKLRGKSKEELEQIRIKKVEKRGGFDKNLFLIDTSKS